MEPVIGARKMPDIVPDIVKGSIYGDQDSKKGDIEKLVEGVALTSIESDIDRSSPVSFSDTSFSRESTSTISSQRTTPSTTVPIESVSESDDELSAAAAQSKPVVSATKVVSAIKKNSTSEEGSFSMIRRELMGRLLTRILSYKTFFEMKIMSEASPDCRMIGYKLGVLISLYSEVDESMKVALSQKECDRLGMKFTSLENWLLREDEKIRLDGQMTMASAKKAIDGLTRSIHQEQKISADKIKSKISRLEADLSAPNLESKQAQEENPSLALSRSLLQTLRKQHDSIVRTYEAVEKISEELKKDLLTSILDLQLSSDGDVRGLLLKTIEKSPEFKKMKDIELLANVYDDQLLTIEEMTALPQQIPSLNEKEQSLLKRIQELVLDEIDQKTIIDSLKSRIELSIVELRSLGSDDWGIVDTRSDEEEDAVSYPREDLTQFITGLTSQLKEHEALRLTITNQLTSYKRELSYIDLQLKTFIPFRLGTELPQRLELLDRLRLNLEKLTETETPITQADRAMIQKSLYFVPHGTFIHPTLAQPTAELREAVLEMIEKGPQPTFDQRPSLEIKIQGLVPSTIKSQMIDNVDDLFTKDLSRGLVSFNSQAYLRSQFEDGGKAGGGAEAKIIGKYSQDINPFLRGANREEGTIIKYTSNQSVFADLSSIIMSVLPCPEKISWITKMQDSLNTTEGLSEEFKKTFIINVPLLQINVNEEGRVGQAGKVCYVVFDPAGEPKAIVRSEVVICDRTNMNENRCDAYIKIFPPEPLPVLPAGIVWTGPNYLHQDVDED